MSGEFSHGVGQDFVDRVSGFFDKNHGFSIFQTAYEGANAASVALNGGRVKFDLIMFQTRKEILPNQTTRKYRVNFYCECKRRTDTGDLKGELKSFLEKALKATSAIQGECSDNFRFMFICNKPFGIDQTNMESIEYLRELLGENPSSDDLGLLSRKVRILVLADWFLQTTSKGSV